MAMRSAAMVSGELAGRLVGDVILSRRAAVVERAHVDLWGLVVWAYSVQRVHRVLRRSGDWFDWAVSEMAPGDCARSVEVDVDAAQVHAAVLDLGYEAATAIVLAAEAAVLPQYSTAQPRMVMVPNEERGRGGAAHAVRGEWVQVEPIRLTPAELVRAQQADAPIEVRRMTSRPVRHEMRYQVDPRPPRRRQRGAQLDGVRQGRTGYGTGCRVWSAWCPLEEMPSAGFIAAVNRHYDLWHGAMTDLMRALSGVRLVTHVVTGFAEPARPCNQDRE